MLVRCLQLFAALTLLVFVAGVPTESRAHGAVPHGVHVYVAASHSAKAAQKAKSFFAEMKSYRSGGPEDQSKENAYRLGYGACCGHGAHQSVATLPPAINEPSVSRLVLGPPYDASKPPQGARALLEHPPKSFA